MFVVYQIINTVDWALKILCWDVVDSNLKCGRTEFRLVECSTVLRRIAQTQNNVSVCAEFTLALIFSSRQGW